MAPLVCPGISLAVTRPVLGGEVPHNVEGLLGLYDEVVPALSAYLSARGYGRSDVEDLVQESFLRLQQTMAAGEAIQNMRAWLFRTAHNAGVNLVRDTRANLTDGEERVQHALENMTERGLNPEEAVLVEERYRRLEQGLQALTEQQVQSLQLRVEGLRYREIAEVLNISPQRVAQLIAAGLKRLATIEQGRAR